ncbi:hypothetical protein [Lentzea kentuckyensis]|uniref:hypothetical protein n=1 Tax=Lentzea kentuckyensis TaxID=360086 RepID=UPI001FE6BCD5|nr:hypothetical protein [Lentzea kentuckyensis]
MLLVAARDLHVGAGAEAQPGQHRVEHAGGQQPRHLGGGAGQLGCRGGEVHGREASGDP